MSTEENKSLVLEFYRGFDERKIEHSLELLAPGFIAHLAGVPQPLSKEEFSKFGMTFYSAFANGTHKFSEIVVEEDKVVTCGIFTATHQNPFQGLPPTGKQVTLAVMHIDRVENGQIVEHWGQGDALGLMQQLGILFLPSPALVPYFLKSFLGKFLRKLPKS